jgi:uncharacterized membrane protein YhaH (DUF805 family)
MGFVEAVRTCLGKYATFSGRARRPEFWWFFLFVMVAGAAATALDILLGTGTTDGGVIAGLVSLGLLLPNLAVTWRRLHDTGRSGWWAATPYGAGVAGVLLMLGAGVARGPGAGPPGGLFQMLAMIVGLAVAAAFVALIVFLLGRSQPGDNRFGPEPPAGGGPAV